MVQERLKSNRNRQSGNPTRLKMLPGFIHCPECDSSMVYKPERNRKGLMLPAHYTCGKHIKKQRLEGEAFCNAKTYRQSVQENAVVTAVSDAVQHPEWIEPALETYRKAKRMPHEVVDHRKELQAVERTLKDIETKQGAAVKAQIAGIMAGASPDAYAGVFAEIAEERVSCQKNRADVMFVSGLFDEVCDTTIQAEHPTFQTKPQTHQIDFKFFTACASYFGL